LQENKRKSTKWWLKWCLRSFELFF